MADNKPLISPEELKSNIIDNAFGDTRHTFYIVYDHLMDQFIIKLVEPGHVAAAYHISENLALLVDPDSFEVVGYQLLEFSEKHIQTFDKFAKIFEENRERDVFGTYQEIEYIPERSKKNSEGKDRGKMLLGYKPRRINHAVPV